MSGAYALNDLAGAWSVLAPGPSLLRHLNTDVGKRGPVVAINNAVLFEHRVDYWALQDPPGKFADTVVPEVRARYGPRNMPVVWCREGEAPKWAALGFRVWPHPSDEAHFRRAFKLTDAVDGALTGFTMGAAIARVIGYLPRTIDLYGVDLRGTGYSCGPDLRHRSPAAWSQRWRNGGGAEAALYSRLEALCLRRHIVLIRH